MMRKLALLVTTVLLLVPLTSGTTAAQAKPRSHRDLSPSFGTALEGAAPTGRGPSATAYDAGSDTVYVANGANPNGPALGGNTVTVIDARRCDARSVADCRGPWPTITVGNEPIAVAVDQEHLTLYVANIGDSTVSVVDLRHCTGRDRSGCSSADVATVPVGNGVFGVHVEPGTDTAYTANFDDNTVSLIDTGSCNGQHPGGCPPSAPPAFTVPDGPGDLDVNGRTHTAYVATVTGFYAFDTHTCNAGTQAGCDDQGFVANCDDCFGAWSLRVDESTNTIYEPDGSNAIAAVDGRACNADDLAGCANAPIGKVRVPGTSFSHLLYLVVDEALESVYVLNHKDDTVVMVDAAVCNGAHTSACETLEPEFVHTGTNPVGIALDSSTHTVYVANQLDHNLAVVDAARCSARDRSGCRVLPPRIRVPGAIAVGVSEDVHTVYVTNDDSITMLDLRSCHLGNLTGCGGPHAHLADAEEPWAVAIDETRHTAYVANFGSGETGSLSVFDTRRCNAHPAGCAMVATLPLTQGFGIDVVVDERTGRVYVGAADPQGQDTVALFDGTTCNATTTTGCGQQPTTMPMAPGAGSCPVPSRMALAVDEPTGTLYAAHLPCNAPWLDDRIYVYDGAGGPPVAAIPAADNPLGLAVDSGTRTLYAPLLGDGEKPGAVAVVDLRHCTAADTSGCGREPVTAPAGFGSLGVAVDQRSHAVYVANDEDASVSVVDGRTCRAGNTSGCDLPPLFLPADDYLTPSIALAPSVRTAYVASAIKGTVSLLPMVR